MTPPKTRAIHGVKGTRDLLPPESEIYAAVEGTARDVFSSFGYGEIRTPILESTELFARSVGETTDIVHKEMYTFEDRGNRSITLRPENTAGVARALIQAGLANLPKPVRVWYTGPQFRYEQPQAGRFREFRQIGAELIGASSPEADAELIGMLFEFLRRLGFAELTTRLNCVPIGPGREAFSNAIRDHFASSMTLMDPDEVFRLRENPLRMFDSKKPRIQYMLSNAPRAIDFLDDRSRAHYEEVKRLLPYGGASFVEDPSLVRGLDYYTLTVFEVVSKKLGAQNAILGGGRYDHLFSDLGGPPVSAIGFAIGEDRLVSVLPNDVRTPRDVFVIVPDSRHQFIYALGVANEIRNAVPSAIVETDFTGKGIVRGIGRASQILVNREEYLFRVATVTVVLLGSRESDEDRVTVKNLVSGTQETFSRRLIPEKLKRSTS